MRNCLKKRTAYKKVVANTIFSFKPQFKQRNSSDSNFKFKFHTYGCYVWGVQCKCINIYYGFAAKLFAISRNGCEEMILCCSVIAPQMECFNIHKQDPWCDLTAANHVSLFKLNIWCMRHLWEEPGSIYAKSSCNSEKIYIVICIKDGIEIFICNFAVMHAVSGVYREKRKLQLII